MVKSRISALGLSVSQGERGEADLTIKKRNHQFRKNKQKTKNRHTAAGQPRRASPNADAPVLVVLCDAQVAVTVDLALSGLELADQQLEKGALSGTVGPDQDNTGVKVNTKIEAGVERVLGVARVGKANRLERKHWWGELVAGREVDGHHVLGLHFLDQAVCLHLVQNLRA
jgi:hypothetical protein